MKEDRTNSSSKRRVAFIFTSSRERTMEGLGAGREADTSLRGLNYIPDADYFTIPAQSIRAVAFIPRLLRYDFVVAQDNLFLGYFISLCSGIFGLRTKWIYMTINSSTLIHRHAKHRLKLFILKKFWLSYAAIACLSSGQIEDLAGLGVPRSRLHLIHFGIDAGFFSINKNDSRGDCVASVGRDSGRDYSSLFKAAELVGKPFTVVAARKNIQDITVPANVAVLYDKSLSEIRDLYSQSRLVAIASKDATIPDGSDCSGQTVILDAMAAGKAVIATARPWISDYFIPGQDIVVVRPGDPDALAKAIEDLWNNEEKRSAIARYGHGKVSEKYTTKAMASALIRLMDSLS